MTYGVKLWSHMNPLAAVLSGDSPAMEIQASVDLCRLVDCVTAVSSIVSRSMHTTSEKRSVL
jgi:hypothetical protein